MAKGHRNVHYMLLPLYVGDDIAGWTMLDQEDYDWACRCRWTIDKHGYARPQSPLLHRMMMGTRRGVDVDHIRHHTLDNRRAELRECTHAENMQNRRRTQYRPGRWGVSYDKARRKWAAKHKLNGKTVNLGRYDTQAEAAEVAARFRAEHMPYVPKEVGV